MSVDFSFQGLQAILLKARAHWDNLLMGFMILAIVGMVFWMLLPTPVLSVKRYRLAGDESLLSIKEAQETQGLEIVPPEGISTSLEEVKPKKTSAHQKYSAKHLAAKNSLDLNQAGISQLMMLPGVGPKMARKILDYRKQHGPFATQDALLNVSGIGPKKLAKMRPYIKRPAT